MIGKSTPMLDLGMHPRKTMDQTVIATRQTNNPVVRGYRVYYGESEEKDDEKMLDEYDLKPTFAYDETENVSTYDEADEVLIDLGIEDDCERHERLEVLGFDDKKIFNINHSTGNNGYNNIMYPDKLIQQYEETIQSLKEQIQLMKLLQDK